MPFVWKKNWRSSLKDLRRTKSPWAMMQTHCVAGFSLVTTIVTPLPPGREALSIWNRAVWEIRERRVCVSLSLSLSLFPLLNARLRHNSFPNRCDAVRSRTARHSYPTCLPASLSLSSPLLAAMNVRSYVQLDVPSSLSYICLFSLSVVCRLSRL